MTTEKLETDDRLRILIKSLKKTNAPAKYEDGTQYLLLQPLLAKTAAIAKCSTREVWKMLRESGYVIEYNSQLCEYVIYVNNLK